MTPWQAADAECERMVKQDSYHKYSHQEILPIIPDFCWQTAQEIYSMFDEIYPDLEFGHLATLLWQWRKNGWLKNKLIEEPTGRAGRQLKAYYMRIVCQK